MATRHWHTSISAGFRLLQSSYPHVHQVILSVCDQYRMDSSVLTNLITTATHTRKGIVASKCDSTIGTPVLFSQTYFTYLQNLPANEGAKNLIKTFRDDVAVNPFEPGKYDIDTGEDLDLLNEFFHKDMNLTFHPRS